MRSVVKRTAIWALGGLAVVPLDAMHVTSGTIPFRQAGLEVAIPMFVLGGLLVGFLHRRVALPLGRRLACAPPEAPWHAVALTAGVFFAAYLSSSFVLDAPPLAVLASYAAAFLLVVALTPKAALPALLLMALGTGLVGPLVEGTFASTGAFRYAHPDFFHVPAWLPGVYLLAGAAVNTLDRALLASEIPVETAR